MIIFENRKFIETKFDNEQEIEDIVKKYSEHFFGPSSIFIPKTLIRTYDGFGTIPDGFAIDLSSRVWFLVEAELGHHSLWNHIAPQITRQITSASRPETGQIIIELIVQMIANDHSILEKFEDENIQQINIRQVLADILQNKPIVAIPIDNISKDLEHWAKTLRNDVRIWIIKKFFEFGNPKTIAYQIPEEYSPTLEISDREGEPSRKITTYEVTILDLINTGLLCENQKIEMTYGPGGNNRQTYQATINPDGGLTINENKFSSPSYAALYCIKDAGSNRDTVNGWTSWKIINGESLSSIREKFLKKQEKNKDDDFQSS